MAGAAPRPLDVPTPLVVPQGALVRGQLPVPGRDLTLDGRPVTLLADGRFMLGIDRDAPPTATLAWITNDGRNARWPVVVEAQPWQIDRLPARLAAAPGPPDPVAEARRAAEVAAVRAARAEITPWPFWQARAQLPADGRISGVFGSQRIHGEVKANIHAGLDIAAPAGSPVKAPLPGIVRLAQGPLMLEGNLIIIDHGQGLSSAYLHLSRIDVKPGQIVRQGEVIGAIGTTGRSTGPHLHWALTWQDVRVNPASLFPPGTIVEETRAAYFARLEAEKAAKENAK